MDQLEYQIKTLRAHKKDLETQLTIEFAAWLKNYSLKGMNRIHEGRQLLKEATEFLEHLETVKRLSQLSGQYYKQNFYNN